MPLLMCPNCNASMSEVSRHGVAFDMCPSCRGVWLDRGELEKVIATAQGAAPAQQSQFDQGGQRDQGQRDQGQHEEGGGFGFGQRRRDRRRDDDDGGFNIFDIFD